MLVKTEILHVNDFDVEIWKPCVIEMSVFKHVVDNENGEVVLYDENFNYHITVKMDYKKAVMRIMQPRFDPKTPKYKIVGPADETKFWYEVLTSLDIKTKN